VNLRAFNRPLERHGINKPKGQHFLLISLIASDNTQQASSEKVCDVGSGDLHPRVFLWWNCLHNLGASGGTAVDTIEEPVDSILVLSPATFWANVHAKKDRINVVVKKRKLNTRRAHIHHSLVEEEHGAGAVSRNTTYCLEFFLAFGNRPDGRWLFRVIFNSNHIEKVFVWQESGE
jgi:hypothetical protein